MCNYEVLLVRPSKLPTAFIPTVIKPFNIITAIRDHLKFASISIIDLNKYWLS